MSRTNEDFTGKRPPPDWSAALDCAHNGILDQVLAAVRARRQTETVYPPVDVVFRALALTPLAQTQVVILGQDPYHGPGQANGLAFSVPPSLPTPPSLKNIFKEIQTDLYPALPQRTEPDLSDWAAQGVLLLNTSLTVAASRPASHSRLGWHLVTDDIIETVSRKRQNVVFLLWGRHAGAKKSLVDGAKHCLLEAAHPSPLSAYRGFFGCGHFTQVNDHLRRHRRPPIAWLKGDEAQSTGL